MGCDLQKLSDAIQRDTPEKLIGKAIEAHKDEIKDALKAGREYILEGTPRLVIKLAEV